MSDPAADTFQPGAPYAFEHVPGFGALPALDPRGVADEVGRAWSDLHHAAAGDRRTAPILIRGRQPEPDA